MMKHLGILFLVILSILFVAGCGETEKKSSKPIPGTKDELKVYACDDLEGVISRDRVEIDKTITSDGSGSFKINIPEKESIIIELFETGDLDVENARLDYQAMMKSQGFEGIAYLVMWVDIPGKGEFFSKDLASPISGDMDWHMEQTPFFLQEGQNPSNVKLQLAIDGKGTIWMDDIKLVRMPLK